MQYNNTFIQHPSSTFEGLSKTLIARADDGTSQVELYFSEKFEDKLNIKLSDDLSLFYIYIRYLSGVQHFAAKKVGNTTFKDNQYLYDISDNTDWEDVQMTQRNFVTKLKKLEELGLLTNITNKSRGSILYQLITLKITTIAAIPVCFLKSKKLSWTNKIRFTKLLFTMQKNNIETIHYKHSLDKSINPKTGLTAVAMNELMQELSASGYLAADTNILNSKTVLLNVTAEQNMAKDSELLILRIANRSKDAKIKLMSRELKQLKANL